MALDKLFNLYKFQFSIRWELKIVLASEGYCDD